MPQIRQLCGLSKQVAVLLGVAVLAGLLFSVAGNFGSDSSSSLSLLPPPPLGTPAPSNDSSFHDGEASGDAGATAVGGIASVAPLLSEEQRLLSQINPLRTGPPVEALGNLTCPKYRFRISKSADSKATHEATVKYSRYVKQYCNSTGLLQMHFGLKVYVHFLDTVARIVKMKPGFRLFDWGCGCGTMLNYYNMKFNTTGVGIDVTDVAIAHARQFGRDNQLFCNLDGADLRAFATESFDAVVSWATLYHVRRTLVQCNIVHELVRMLKPGGVAYIGHLRTEKTQEYWRKGRCRPPGASIVRYRDARTFHMSAFRRNDFFSLVVRKFDANETDAAPKTTPAAKAKDAEPTD